jgi:hypothetical protein
MAAMRGDNIIVGIKPTTSRSASVIVEDVAERTGLLRPAIEPRDPVTKRRPDVCGAMSQQRCDSGGQSTPQKFVRLIGCSDPRIKPQPKR